MAVFRAKLRHLLQAAVQDQRLVIPASTTAARVLSLLNRLGRSPWNVRIQERYPHGVSVAGYLARYITGGPLSNRRIHSVTDTAVSFWYRDHRDGRKKLLSLTPDEFLSRWFEHVPPRGMRTIRRSGLYANSNAKKREQILQQLQTEPQTEPQNPPPVVSALEPERCPRCNTPVICRDLVLIPGSLPNRPKRRVFSVRLNQPP